MQDMLHLIYHVDPTTSEFLRAEPALMGPAGDIQVPAFATLTTPPEASPGNIAVVIGEIDLVTHACTWTSVKSWRGIVVYRKGDGSSVAIGPRGIGDWTGLGDLPSVFTEDPRPSDFHVWRADTWMLDVELAKDAKRAEIDAECSTRQACPFLSGDYQFAATPAATAQILSAAQFAGVAKLAGREYTAFLSTADGLNVLLNADQLIDVAMSLGEHQAAVQFMAERLKADVAGASDVESLSAIVWS